MARRASRLKKLFGGGFEYFPGVTCKPIPNPSLFWITRLWFVRELAIALLDHGTCYARRPAWESRKSTVTMWISRKTCCTTRTVKKGLGSEVEKRTSVRYRRTRNHRTFCAARMAKGTPETLDNTKQRTGIARCGGIRSGIYLHIPIHVRWCNALKTSEHDVEAWPVTRLRFPTKFQHPPYIICKPRPSRTFRSHGAFATQDPENRGRRWIERRPPIEHFINHHPERIPIRLPRWVALLQTETSRVEEFWTHPRSCATLYA